MEKKGQKLTPTNSHSDTQAVSSCNEHFLTVCMFQLGTFPQMFHSQLHCAWTWRPPTPPPPPPNVIWDIYRELTMQYVVYRAHTHNLYNNIQYELKDTAEEILYFHCQQTQWNDQNQQWQQYQQELMQTCSLLSVFPTELHRVNQTVTELHCCIWWHVYYASNSLFWVSIHRPGAQNTQWCTKCVSMHSWK